LILDFKATKMNLVQPIIALVFVQLLFGALPVASKFILVHAHPLFVVVLRSLFAALFFFVLHRFFSTPLERSRQTTNEGDVLHKTGEFSLLGQPMPFNIHLQVALLSFFGITFNQMALFIALPHTTAAVTSVISPSIALFTLVFSVLLGRERFQLMSCLAILMGASGVLVVLNPFASSVAAGARHGEVWADVLNVMSAASYAFYLALVGRLPTVVGAFRFSLLLFFYGFLMNLVVLAVYSGLVRVGWISAPATLTIQGTLSALPSSFWFGLAFLLMGATALTYFLNNWALQRVKPSLVGGFVCLQTVFGLFLSKQLLNETLTNAMVVGSVLITSGVCVLAFQHLRKKNLAAC
jgi:drug/metabolite transporter (DMT)-like permease